MGGLMPDGGKLFLFNLQFSLTQVNETWHDGSFLLLFFCFLQGDSTSKDDNVFYDPNDEWEQDISTSSASTSSFSRRR